jgi:hypothetical protein
MQTRLALGLIVIAIAGTVAISLSTLVSIPEIFQVSDYGPSDSVFVSTAQAGAALNERDVAKIMRVRVSETGTTEELVFGSFSRIGFISGGPAFLLESLPSEDKKPFYRFVKESLESQQNVLANPTYLDVKIDIFSGDYDLIETLSYEKCFVFDYFLHAEDSRGKVPFLDDGSQSIEFREVTKFTCSKYEIIIDE